MTSNADKNGPLNGIKVIDLSRVLAGPSATQILGDMGADVIKIERPGIGDDTRTWGPPFVQKPDGSDSTESAYYLSANRSKRSIEIDIKTPEGQKTLRSLIAKADILVENFKTGGLTKYGLGYNDLKSDHPQLIYASLTGFGQTGPYADVAGYDFMIQAMGGIMSVTGPADGTPYKTGVAISDLMAGQYLLNGILAALYARENTGAGQHIDVALFDTQLAWLANLGQYYLTSNKNPPRVGNAHATIVPYEVFKTADSHVVLAIGNDTQFQKFCAAANRPDLGDDINYQTNPTRVQNRVTLIPIIQDIMASKTTSEWLETLQECGVPVGPVNTIKDALSHPQTNARDMIIEVDHPDTNAPVKLIANPIKFSDTKISYAHAPPKHGADTDTILKDWLDD